MINNYFILKAEADFLNAHSRDCIIHDFYTPERDILILELAKNGVQEFLKISLEKNLETFFLLNSFSRPKKNVFGIFENIYGLKISGFKINDRDRIVNITLEHDYTILISFIPNRSNVFLLKNGLIVNSFSEKDKYTGKDINIFNPVSGENAGSEKPLIKQFGYLGKYYSKEASARADAQGKAPEENHIREFENIIKEINNSSKYYLYKEKTFIPSPVKLSGRDYELIEEFDDINTLISVSYSKIKHRDRYEDSKSKLLSDNEKKIKELEKKIGNLKGNLVKAEDSSIHKISADIIMRNLHLIERNSKSFEYTDSVSGEKKTIKLNDSLSPAENANLYYEKYKGLKKSVSLIKDKIGKYESELVNLQKQKDRIISENDTKNLVKMLKKEETENEKLPFREFRLHDKFVVWVGKDSKSNDLLTMKYCNQYDLWFHVRGASGSHTVLRFEDKNLVPDKSLILKAASIAAYYSKARNGRNVPVAYCERKYVKKRKGFKEGAVVMEKEKVVFVNPEIPSE
ncbi:MAG: NFACT RNA binding domain-containing protein [Ignavibacteria bacterium]|nr:NFACT RNA binding domain-containing protein [Ignavibacteria bacterium]